VPSSFLHKVLEVVRDLQDPQGWFDRVKKGTKELVKVTSTTEKIEIYRQKLESFRFEFLVLKFI
jgi:hypothetical protein